MTYPADLNRPLALLAVSSLWDAVGGGALVVACSGGADSVALARGALELLCDPHFTQRFAKLPRLVLWHLDHGIRDGSGSDAQFVEELAESLRAEVVIDRAEIGRRVADEGGNLEAEARTERYTRLLAFIGDQFNWRAVTAHHLNDQAETVLHHLIRGTHLAGLRGISPQYRGVVFRPWLDLRRSEIVAYLDSRGQSYITDPSNADTSFTRNRLRHDVLPILEQINPAALEHIARLSTLAREAVDHQQEQLAELEVQVFNANELALWLPLLGWPRGYEVHRLWDGWVESTQLAVYAARLLRSQLGVLSAQEHATIGDWGADPDIALAIREVSIDLPHPQLLTITSAAEPAEAVELILQPSEPLTFGGLQVELTGDPQSQWQLFRQRDKHVWEKIRRWPDALAAMCASGIGSNGVSAGGNSWECFLGDVKFPLRLRTWSVGERMELAGGGSSTIGDLFTNAKLPEPLRP
ncbi:MAG: tRNA lysidine(34) synthetase TilS, partial [bacterium]|nr:tRNA lysidine(34) synthetase TilS [bacterium]